MIPACSALRRQQGYEFRWRDNLKVRARKIGRITRNQEVDLCFGGTGSLYRVFEILPVKCQCLEKAVVVDRHHSKYPQRIGDGGLCAAHADVPLQEIEERRRRMRGHESLCASTLNVREQECSIVGEGLAISENVENDVCV